jgi:hypothetical protein
MPHVDVGLPTRVKAEPPDPRNPPTLPDDAYPAGYQDQRTMLAGGLDCEDADDVFWRCWAPHLEQHQHRAPRIDEENREVVPYLNGGRWVADCPACGCGMACWDRNPYACCLGLGCGRMFKVRWQLPTERSEVMRLLAGRPEQARNWDAHKGETIEELKIQNVLMLGVPAVERNGLLIAQNVILPDELTDPNEYLDTLRRKRRAREG